MINIAGHRSEIAPGKVILSVPVRRQLREALRNELIRNRVMVKPVLSFTMT